MSAGAPHSKVLSQSIPYVAPLLAFMIFLSVEGSFHGQHYVLYPIKTALVVLILAWFWRALPSLRPSSLFLSIAVGTIAILLWVGLDPWALRLDIALEQIFNRVVGAVGLTSWQMTLDTAHPNGVSPFDLYSPGMAWTLFVLRVLGITLCVPVMEELFWRGFLMRWLIREDFMSVPLGTFQPLSFWVTTIFFASVHGTEWPQALIVGILYGAWFVRTKNLGDVMVAHGMTNLLLCAYSLFSGDWHFLCPVAGAPLPK
jgi:CAAX prenyl protease-like protein